MFDIKTINSISPKGIAKFTRDTYNVGPQVADPDAIIVRSANLSQLEFAPALKAIARAGSGTNNIPIERCSEDGIVVFNTPGANANSVTELAIAGLLLSSRRIVQGVEWTRGLVTELEDISTLIEGGKSQFVGPEIAGKTLGVIGLGMIGVRVANSAQALGMTVIGYDPFISIEAAWVLSGTIHRAKTIQEIVGQCDYLSVHVPLTEKTRGMIGEEAFRHMKPGTRMQNFAREALVDRAALIAALDDGTLCGYTTDFPDRQLLERSEVVCLPHLGASTPEAVENCASMAADQLKDYLQNGNITNSVNFAPSQMPRSTAHRLAIVNDNIPQMVGKITVLLAEGRVNIAAMVNCGRNDLAYTMIDIDAPIEDRLISAIRRIDGVRRCRLISET